MPGCALAALGSQALRARPCQFHGQAGSVARGGMSSAVQEAACGHLQQQCFWASALRGPRSVLPRNSRWCPPPAPGHYPDHELEPGAPEGFRARLARADASSPLYNTITTLARVGARTCREDMWRIPLYKRGAPRRVPDRSRAPPRLLHLRPHMARPGGRNGGIRRPARDARRVFRHEYHDVAVRIVWDTV